MITLQITKKIKRLQLKMQKRADTILNPHYQSRLGSLSIFMEKCFSVSQDIQKLLYVRSPKYLYNIQILVPCVLVINIPNWRVGDTVKDPSGSLVPALRTTGVSCLVSCWGSQFSLLFFSFPYQPSVDCTRTLTEARFSLSPHLVYVFTTARSHPPLNDSPSSVSTQESN